MRVSQQPVKARREGGFTLIEVTVGIAVLVVVLILSFSLLFGMKSFAQRQQHFIEARQTARRAIDYLSYYVRGASDLNTGSTTNPLASPNALVMWVCKQWTGSPGTGSCSNLVQVSYDNMGSNSGDPAVGNTAGVPPATGAVVADPGTDILTLAFAVNARKIPITYWPGQLHGAGNVNIDFRDGCDGSSTQDQKNMLLFEQLTGCQDPNNPESTAPCDGTFPTGSSAVSNILTLTDSTGNWVYYQITDYQGCNCGSAAGTSFGKADVIQVINNAGLSDGLNPPGGPQTLTMPPPPSISAGVDYYSFRVLNGQLQQKTGMFDPATDNPGTAFHPLLDNVEDLQIAYIFDDGSIRNNTNAVADRLPTSDHNIPQQNTLPTAATTDISKVVGLRITVVARSSAPMSAIDIKTKRYPLLTAEDHVPTQPPAGNVLYRYNRYSLSATVMLRSRSLGN